MSFTGGGNVGCAAVVIRKGGINHVRFPDGGALVNLANPLKRLKRWCQPDKSSAASMAGMGSFDELYEKVSCSCHMDPSPPHLILFSSTFRSIHTVAQHQVSSLVSLYTRIFTTGSTRLHTHSCAPHCSDKMPAVPTCSGRACRMQRNVKVSAISGCPVPLPASHTVSTTPTTAISVPATRPSSITSSPRLDSSRKALLQLKEQSVNRKCGGNSVNGIATGMTRHAFYLHGGQFHSPASLEYITTN